MAKPLFKLGTLKLNECPWLKEDLNKLMDYCFHGLRLFLLCGSDPAAVELCDQYLEVTAKQI